MWNFVLSILSSDIAQALIIALITAVAASLAQSRGKLIYGIGSNFMYLLPPAKSEGAVTPITSRQIWFENPGRQTIKDIEIILTHKPSHFEIWPPRAYTVEPLTEVSSAPRVLVKLASLNGRETFQLHMLDFDTNGPPDITGVRWDGGLGKNVRMTISRRYPTWFDIATLALLVVGLATLIYQGWQVAVALMDLYSRIAIFPTR